MARTILVVEDDRAVASYLSDLLEAEGYRVLVETDGEWGLRTAQSKPVDLMILDMLLPQLVGFDVLQRLRQEEKGRNLPVIAISGVYRGQAQKDALVSQYKILEYLEKPIDQARLLEVIRKAFGQPVLTGQPRRVGGLVTVPPDVHALDEVDPRAKLAGFPIPRLGHLVDVPFARLVGQLSFARASGALMLRRGQVKKIVQFRYGIPMFVKSNLIAECLGHVMVRERLISEAQCDLSVERLKRERRKQGVILVEMGAISPHNLAFALERQLEIKLFDLFTWTEGKYLFSEKEEYEGPAVALSLSPAELVYEGARRFMTPERTRAELEKVAGRVTSRANDPTLRYQALELDPHAGPLLDLLDGTRRLRDLMARPEGATASARTLLYALYCTSLIKLRDSSIPPPRSSRSEEVIPLAEGDLELLEGGDAGEEASPAVAEALARARVARGAVEAANGPPRTGAQPPPPPPSSGEIYVSGSVFAAASLGRGRPSDPGPPPVLSSQARAEARARLEASLTVPGSPQGTDSSQALTILGGRADLEAEQHRRLAELERQAERLRKRNHYERLGVHRLASPEEIAVAYEAVQSANDLDPSAAGGEPPKAREVAEEILLLYQRAYDALMNPVERAAYDRELGDASGEARLAPMFRAEECFERGLTAEAAGEWHVASTEFDAACEADPGEGRYQAHQAWASFWAQSAAPDAGREAMAQLAKVAEDSPPPADVFFFAGAISEKLGQREDALRFLRRTIELNPDHVRAQRALRAIAPPVERRGFFRRG